MTIALLGIDLAKNVFALHGLDEASQSAPVLEEWISDSVVNVEGCMNGRSVWRIGWGDFYSKAV